MATEEPFNPPLKGFLRVFTATPEELQRYMSLDDETLKRQLMMETWMIEDIKALEFIIQRWVLVTAQFFHLKITGCFWRMLVHLLYIGLS